MRRSLYGLTMDAPWPLPCPAGEGPVDVKFVRSARKPSPRPRAWFARERSADGTEHLVWRDTFEFDVAPDGRQVSFVPLAGASETVLQTYVLSQVLSFVCLNLGREVFHATALERDGQAVALTGLPGQGKSTLAAALLTRGWRMLTDDLMLLDGDAVMPGFGRIKLFPRSAKILGLRGTPMGPDTKKEAIQLPPQAVCAEPRALAGIYVLKNTQSQRATLRRLGPRSSFVELTRNTYNDVVTEPDRLARQLQAAASLVTSIPVKSLSFPRRLAALPMACEAIERDLMKTPLPG